MSKKSDSTNDRLRLLTQFRPVRRWPLRAGMLGAGFILVLLSVTILYAQMARSGAQPSALGDYAVASTVSQTQSDGTTTTHSLASVTESLKKSLPHHRGEPADGSSASPLSPDTLKQLSPLLGQAEARLIDIYQLIGQGEHRSALVKVESLVRDHPNFHLAQLVMGDLLNMHNRTVIQLGDVENVRSATATQQLAVLREESRRRIMALVQRPPDGHLPKQFLSLSSQSRHAIAIDASRSRLYLFENQSRPGQSTLGAPQLKLISDFYISVGLQGIDKYVEGDKRTPLGVYYITSHLKPDNLPDLYGVGALPINYPNALDTQRGKTGSGIWLHGTPREQFVRAPQASDGCVVLSNPDLERLMATVQIRTTPVVIAPELHWVDPSTLEAEREQFAAVMDKWRQAKSQGDRQGLKSFYSSRFSSQGRNLTQWWPRTEDELRTTGPRERELKDVSILHWQDKQDTMVVTFGEVIMGQTRGVTRRQYWLREGSQWKIFYEGNA